MSAALRSLSAACAAAFALGCASDAEAPNDPARLSVEVLRGFAPGDLAPQEGTAPVVLLLDATRSMLSPTGQGASHFAAAQRSATRFANELPSQRAMWLYALGTSESHEVSARAARVARSTAAGARPGRRGDRPPVAAGRRWPRRGARDRARRVVARRCVDGARASSCSATCGPRAAATCAPRRRSCSAAARGST
jgi:hypothetical protein